jgi:protein-tyrosine phosphatase
MYEREIAFERCFNFRDLGGYAASDGRTVRWRRLFRGMTPEYMSPSDLQRARDDLGIGAVLDLRRLDGGIGSGALGEEPGVRAVVPFADSREYTELRTLPHDEVLAYSVGLNGRNIVQALEFIADQPGGTMFHCQTGKDRTGLLAAVTLKLLGVADEDVVADFALSVPAVEVMLREGLPVLPPDAPVYARIPPEEAWIRAVLVALDAQGGAEAYLRAHGASDALIASLRDSLLE